MKSSKISIELCKKKRQIWNNQVYWGLKDASPSLPESPFAQEECFNWTSKVNQLFHLKTVPVGNRFYKTKLVYFIILSSLNIYSFHIWPHSPPNQSKDWEEDFPWKPFSTIPLGSLRPWCFISFIVFVFLEFTDPLTQIPLKEWKFSWKNDLNLSTPDWGNSGFSALSYTSEAVIQTFLVCSLRKTPLILLKNNVKDNKIIKNKLH